MFEINFGDIGVAYTLYTFEVGVWIDFANQRKPAFVIKQIYPEVIGVKYFSYLLRDLNKLVWRNMEIGFRKHHYEQS